MPTAVLFDIDSRIPNLALMKLSAYYKRQGYRVVLRRKPERLKAEVYFASAVFHTETSLGRIDELERIYGDDLQLGGSGIDLTLRLPLEVEACFPDYSLYHHDHYALGFLTRGCPKRCAFCVVPIKEGRVKAQSAAFADFVPPGQKQVMLLDDNLLSYPGVESLLEEMIRRQYAVNFSQTLDITWLTPEIHQLLVMVDSQNARFTRRRIYFSCNYPGTIRHFQERRGMLKEYGQDGVSVVCIYGFDTTLSQDYHRWYWLRRMLLIPFFQEYWPIQGVPSRLPQNYFDMDLDKVIRLTFRSNGQNWEKYLRWLNRLYFHAFGRYYLPLVQTIYRYNNRERIRRYLESPQTLTTELYRSYL